MAAATVHGTNKKNTTNPGVPDPIDDSNLQNQTSDHKSNKQKSEPARTHVTITPKGDESVESLLRRFNREVMRAGIIKRMKELEHYEKPSVKRKREREERRKMRKQGYRGFEEFEWMEK